MDAELVLKVLAAAITIGGFFGGLYTVSRLNEAKIKNQDERQKEMHEELKKDIEKIEGKVERHDERIRSTETQGAQILEKINSIDSKIESLVSIMSK